MPYCACVTLAHLKTKLVTFSRYLQLKLSHTVVQNVPFELMTPPEPTVSDLGSLNEGGSGQSRSRLPVFHRAVSG